MCCTDYCCVVEGVERIYFEEEGKESEGEEEEGVNVINWIKWLIE